jgi:hypothetical protein
MAALLWRAATHDTDVRERATPSIPSITSP